MMFIFAYLPRMYEYIEIAIIYRYTKSGNFVRASHRSYTKFFTEHRCIIVVRAKCIIIL